jgi:hypothetical protein
MKKSKKPSRRKMSLAKILSHPTLKHSRFSKANLIIFILIFAGIGGYLIYSSFAATDTGAADFYISPNGSDSNPGTQSQPFATFDKCYRAKSPVVCEVANGNYSTQAIKFDLTKTSSALGATFRPAAGASVTIGGSLNLYGTTYFTWLGPITVNGSIDISTCNIVSNCTSGTVRYAKGVTIDGQSQDACKVVGQPSGGGNLNVDGSSDITYRYCFSDKRKVTPGPSGLSTSPSAKDGQVPSNITYDHVHWYGGSNPTHLADCLHIIDINGLTVKNNNFEWCEDYPILFNRTNGAADAASENPSLIENTVCRQSQAGNNSFSLGNPNTESIWNLTVRFNTCGLSLSNTTPTVNVIYQGNARPVTSGANCNTNAGLTADHNLNWDTKGGVTPAFGTSCGGRDTYVNVPTGSIFVNRPADLHLNAGSPAIGAAQGLLSFPSVDFDDIHRPQDSLDAGAYEYAPPPVIWVSTNGDDATCVRGDQNSPCLTLNKAYQIAVSGDKVQIESGTYGAQDIGYNPSISDYVTFSPLGTVTFSGSVCLGNTSSGRCDGVLRDPPSWVKFDQSSGKYIYKGGIQTIYRNRAPSHLWLDGGRSSAALRFSYTDGLILRNFDVGPSCCTSDAIDISSGQDGAPLPRNILIENVYVHDVVRYCADYPGQSADGIGPASCPGDSTAHIDALQFGAALDGVTIRNYRTHNTNQALFFGGTSHTAPLDSPCRPATTQGCYSGNITLENIFIGEGDVTWGIMLCGGAGTSGTDGICAAGTSILLRNVTAVRGIDIGGQQFGPPADSVRFVNVLSTFQTFKSCQPWPGVTYQYSHNAFSDKTCGPTDKIVGPITNQLANYATGDFHLKADSLAIDAGDPNDCPAADLDGNTRPQGSACDAGADEYVLGSSTTKPGDVNSDGRVDLQDLSILLTHYAQSASSSQGDLSGDNLVTLVDLSILLSHYGG